MEWLFKAALAAGTVLLVTAAAQRFGPRAAGAVAALPTITAPTLAWLAHERGIGFAAGAAVGSVASCAVLAAFGLGYALAARRCGVLMSMACGLASALLLALPALAASDA